MNRYIPRIADSELADRLEAAGAVLVEGPRACGKTELARQKAASEVLLDVDENVREAVSLDPRLILSGETPRLIDEWQVEPIIWNHVRREVDLRADRGQFILTGSAVPADDITRHTGAGRVSRLRLRTMSSFETGFSTGQVSLSTLMAGTFEGASASSISVSELIEAICRGGWPGDLNLPLKAAMTARVDYLDEICRADISRIDGVSRDPVKVNRLIRSLARNLATPASLRTLASDVGGEAQPIDSETANGYLAALIRLLVVEEQPAWSPRLRSRSVLRKSPKRHFVDPSLAVAALGATPDRLLNDLKYLGFLFESMVFRDIAIYARASGADVYHYRDNTHLEIDMLVQDRRGDWCAFEVKLGVGKVEQAADALLRLRDRLDLAALGEPAMLGVIVGSGYAYQRPDGICVIPVGVLGP